MEKRTARLTLLIDPEKKALFEQLCANEDVTPSQKVRQFIRDYIEQNGIDQNDNTSTHSSAVSSSNTEG